MQTFFEIRFPLVLESGGSFSITFTSRESDMLELKEGVYYLSGDNGSGKTTFLNMLSLIAGAIGRGARRYRGSICFNGEAYNGSRFDHIRAAEIREKYFCIFPQKAFFLPVSSRDNYMVLNGSDQEKMTRFSTQQYPDFLSGGQQQKILMDIILDEKKPVWFLDEPLANLDAERRHYFWERLDTAYRKGLRTAFFIDHWLGRKIAADSDFEQVATIRASMAYHQKNMPAETEEREIQVFQNSAPERFFNGQMSQG